tara:strand:- start:15761 stop:16096 length:336 start_codon:yes stop_codon:yes gene_type:complete
LAGVAGAAAVGGARGGEAAAAKVMSAGLRGVCRTGVGIGLPSVARGVYGGEGDTAVDDFEKRLVFQVQCAGEARGYGLREAHDGIVVDDCAGSKSEGPSRDAGCDCKQLKE